MSVGWVLNRASLALMVALPLVLGACTADPVAPGSRITAVTVTVISGDGQAAEVGTRLPEPIGVRMEWVYGDGTTAPAVGQTVVFEDQCWDQPYLGDCQGSHERPPQTPQATTDSAGEARIWWDLSTRAVRHTIRVYWGRDRDCSPVCRDSVTATGNTVTAMAYPGPVHSWAVDFGLQAPRVEGSMVSYAHCVYEGYYYGVWHETQCYPDEVYMQSGDVLIASVRYSDQYGNSVAPCDTVGAEWQLIDWPMWASLRTRVAGPQLYLTEPTDGSAWGGGFVGGWVAVAAEAGAGCKDLPGRGAEVYVYIKP